MNALRILYVACITNLSPRWAQTARLMHNTNIGIDHRHQMHMQGASLPRAWRLVPPQYFMTSTAVFGRVPQFELKLGDITVAS